MAEIQSGYLLRAIGQCRAQGKCAMGEVIQIER